MLENRRKVAWIITTTRTWPPRALHWRLWWRWWPWWWWWWWWWGYLHAATPLLALSAPLEWSVFARPQIRCAVMASKSVFYDATSDRFNARLYKRIPFEAFSLFRLFSFFFFRFFFLMLSMDTSRAQNGNIFDYFYFSSLFSFLKRCKSNNNRLVLSWGIKMQILSGIEKKLTELGWWGWWARVAVALYRKSLVVLISNLHLLDFMSVVYFANEMQTHPK